MNVLSLFNGMSCGMLALLKAGIKVDKYYSSEIDKYSSQVSQKNFPEIIQIGDVTKVSGFDYDVDLLIAGSPCQGFSFAGRQLNFEDPRSKLFFDFVRILKEVRVENPNVLFLLENVKMKKEYEKIISDILGVEPIEINSSLVSAQNRKRIYWTNIPNIEQPEDNKMYLKNIIDSGVVDRDKSFCLDASYYKGGNIKQYFEKNRRQLVFELNKINPRVIDVSIDKNGIRPHRGDLSKSGISEMGRLFFMDAEKTYTVIASHAPKVIDEIGYRKLTPIECERLQTVPDNFTDCVSNSQRYKMLGNGWTVDIIAHIFKNIGQEPKTIEPSYKPQLALF